MQLSAAEGECTSKLQQTSPHLSSTSTRLPDFVSTTSPFPRLLRCRRRSLLRPLGLLSLLPLLIRCRRRRSLLRPLARLSLLPSLLLLLPRLALHLLPSLLLLLLLPRLHLLSSLLLRLLLARVLLLLRPRLPACLSWLCARPLLRLLPRLPSLNWSLPCPLPPLAASAASRCFTSACSSSL